MKLKILQGLNHISDYSIVEIQLDAKPQTEILDLVNSYHKVFLKSYSVDSDTNTVQIETKLPQLWREAAVALNNLATGVWTEAEAKKYILWDVIRSQVFSMSTIPVLTAAQELGLEANQVMVGEGIDYFDDTKAKGSKWNRYYRIGSGRASGISVSAGCSKDSNISIAITRDKRLSNSLIDRMQLPIAPWEMIPTENDLDEIFTRYSLPVVIKPSGLTQGSGVTTNIKTLEHAKEAFRYAKKRIALKDRPFWQQQVMIQQQVPGDDYRILVINGKYEIATKRIPAYVTGDGNSTIRELIEETNKDPRRDLDNPAHTLKPINFDEPLDEYIAEQGLTLDHVPQADERLYVRKVASMSQGGNTEDFTDIVHPQIRYSAESIAASIHANVVGIDVICADISKPLTLDNGSLIEINTMPESYLNAFPVIGQQHEDIGHKIIAGILKGTDECRKYVVIGGSTDDLMNYLSNAGLQNTESNTGLLSGQKMYINGVYINDIDDMSVGVRSLKLNASLANIVLHYKDIAEFEQYGSGFDSFDVLITDEVPEKFVEYKSSGKVKDILLWGEIL